MPEPEPTPDPAREEDLERLVGQLQSEEAEALEAHLSSYESFQMWLVSHPGLQQPGIYEMINTYGPAILQLVRRMLGA